MGDISPKCTANALSATDSEARRRKKGVIARPMLPGIMLAEIRSAPDTSPFIARMKARARHAARSLRRSSESSTAIASSGLPVMPSERA
ncbi:MAG: hypothetical protein V4574_03330 [Pseudomonadota bacterium]